MAEMEVDVATRSTKVYKAIDPRLDVGRMLIEDLDPLEVNSKGVTEDLLRNLARDNTQYMVNELWKLPTEKVDETICATLPTPTIRIPREKPIPKEKPPSKWEEYRRAKGIQKHKKSRKVYDEIAKDWKPRWGYNRANDTTKEWMVEIPDNADPSRDFYGERIQAKKERIAKNEMQRMRNLSRGQKPDPIPDGIGFTAKNKSTKQLSYQISQARGATASMGRFNEAVRNEKPPKDRRQKRQFAPNEVSGKSEKEAQMSVLKRLNAKKPKLNIEKAVNHEQQAGEIRNRTARRATEGKRNKAGSMPKRTRGKKGVRK